MKNVVFRSYLRSTFLEKKMLNFAVLINNYLNINHYENSIS